VYLPLRHSARRDFAGGFSVTAFRSRFTSLSVSRPSGERASPRHLRERNRTSTAPKLSKTLRSRPFIPDAHRHFEGTDRSFAMYAVFPHSDYYALFDCLQGLGAFGAGLPCLLPTLLPIPLMLSRVHHGGLQQDAVGGVLLGVPSALCGSSVVLWGKAGGPTGLRCTTCGRSPQGYSSVRERVSH